MSILFDDLSSQYLQVSAVPTLTFPLALSCWVYIDDLLEDQTVFSIGNSGSEDNYFSLAIQGLREEVTDITTVANVTSDTLAGKYFLLDSPTTAYYVWFDVSDGSTDPAPVGKTPIEVDITPGDTANEVATALQLALDAETDFSASVLSNVVTVTNAATGSVSDAVDVDTGFTINVTTQGTDEALAIASLSDNFGTLEQAFTTIGLTVNTWHNILGMFFKDSGGTDIYAYLDGTNEGTSLNGSTVFPTGLDQTAIGRLSKQTPTEYTSGRIAEAAIWNLGTIFTASEIDDIGADKMIAALVRPEELALYTPIEDNASPVIDVIEHNNLTLFNAPTTADHPPLRYYEPEIYGRFRSGPVQFDREVIENLILTQAANVERVVPASNDVSFGHVVGVNVIVLEVQTNINLDHSIRKTGTHNVSVETAISLQDKGSPTTEESASNSIGFTQEAARAGDPSNDILFTDVVAAVASTGAQNTVGFGSTVNPNVELTIALAHGILFGQTVLPIIDTPCNRHEYDPQGTGLPAVSFGAASDILLDCGVDSVILPNPEFGNSEESEVDRVINVSRGGTPKIFRDAQWAEDTIVTIEVITLKETKAIELSDFLLNCIGLLVTYTDYEGRQWQGIILNPEEALIETREDQYSANIVMAARPV
jgi:hypothetical protein